MLQSSALLGLANQLSAQEKNEAEVVWQDVKDWPIEGRGWPKAERLRFFDRFPSKAKETLRAPVWNLSQHSAGMAVRFRSDAERIHLRYKLLNPGLAMPHMPATGVSGVDLYARDGKRWRWVGATKPTKQNVTTSLAANLDPGEREYLAYLPLYNGVETMAFGVEKGAKLEPLPARGKPVVFYGTSITQGACASRPGMCHTAILGRLLDRETLNLGFSGNGRMELEVADLLAELDAAAYVIDCLPNITGDAVAERTAPLVHRIRKDRPDTPIILVEDRTNANAWIKQGARDRHEYSRDKLQQAFEQLKHSGVQHLHYIEGATLIGKDGDGTTDGSHPNDLGFARQARAMLPVLKAALAGK